MLEIKNIFFQKGNKEIYRDFSFTLENQEILTCLYNKNIEKKEFLKLLLGKVYPYEGDIKLNNNEITTLKKSDRNIFLVKSRSFSSLFFIPVKIKLMLHTIIDPAFIYKSLNDYYLKISQNKLLTGRNQQQIFLLEQLNEIFQNNIDLIIKNNIEKTSSFLTNINILHSDNVEFLLKGHSSNLTKKWIKTYLSKNSELFATENLLIFFQMLYDLISSSKELRLSCDCEKNIRDNKLKVSKKDFYYHELDSIIEKQLNKISIEIIRKRYQLFSLKHKINIYKRIIKTNLKKYESDKILYKNINRNILNYKKERIFNKKIKSEFTKVKKLENDFIEKEKKINKNSLKSNFFILQNQVVEMIHNYHKILLREKPVSISKKIYNKEIKELNIKYNRKTEFNNIYALMNTKLDTITSNLNVKQKNIFSDIFSSDFSKILGSIISALLSEKQIIILDQIFDKLTIKEQSKLKEILDKMFIHYPTIKLIILSKNILYNNPYITKYLLLTDYSNFIANKNSLNKKYISKPKNLIWYKSIFRNNGNIFTYSKFKKIDPKLKNEISENSINKWICINPIHINFERKNQNEIQIFGKIKSIKQQKSNFYLIKFKSNQGKTIKILKEYEINKNNKIENVFIDKNYILIYEKSILNKNNKN